MAVPSLDIGRSFRRITHIDSGLEKFKKLSRTAKIAFAATLLTISASCVSVAVSSANREPSSAAAVTIYPTRTPEQTPTVIPTATSKPTETPRPVVTIAATQVVSESIGGQDATDPKDLKIPGELEKLILSVNAAYKIEGEGYGVPNREKRSIFVEDKNNKDKNPYVLNTKDSQYLAIVRNDTLGNDSEVYNITRLPLTDTVVSITDATPYKDFLAKILPAQEVVKIDYQKLIRDKMKELGIKQTMNYRGFTFFDGDENVSYSFNAPEFNMPSNGVMIYYADLPNPSLVNMLESLNPEIERWIPNQVTLNTTPTNFPFNFTRFHFPDDSNFFVVTTREGRRYYTVGVPDSFTYGITLPLITQKQYYSLDFYPFKDKIPELYARLNKK